MKILNGWTAGRDKIVVSILQYADDTLIFCPNNVADIARWWNILNLVMAGLGLSLDMAKTSVIGININLTEVTNCANNFSCQADSFPINYLGFPRGKFS